MLNLCSIELQAHNHDRNHHRRYSMTVGKDLFGLWTLAVEYGRVGRAGQLQRYSAASIDDLGRLMTAKLRKRGTSTKRIGCSYQITSVQGRELLDSIAGLHGA